MGIFLGIGLFVAFFSPVEYTSDTSITPEYELQDQVNEIIESYGLLFGLTGNIRKYRSHSYLLDQYPQIINSTSFQYALMRQPFSYNKKDTVITMFDYFTRIHQPSLTEVVYNYTIGLPSILFNTSPSDNSQSTDVSANNRVQNVSPVSDSLFPVLNPDPVESRVINELSSRITATFNSQAGILNIQTKMPEPILSATLARLTLKELHKRARAYKTEKARLYLEYLQNQLDESREKLEEARSALIESAETDNQLFTERLELQSNYEASLNHYNSITEQINRIETDIANQNPVFRVIDDITVPNQKSEPDRKQIIILSILSGVFLAVCLITIMFFASRLKEQPS